MSKLVASTEYEVRVAAVNEAGIGPWVYGVFKTEAIPPQTIVKFYSSLNDKNLSLSWAVKDKLRDTEAFELFECVGRGGNFTCVYEGVDLSQKRVVVMLDTVYQYKVRVKREDDACSIEYGPYSQTITISVKSKPVENAKSDKRDSGLPLTDVIETENDDERKLTVLIFGSLCLPALLIIICFMYGTH